MPENPEAKARQDLVTRLRAHGRIEEHTDEGLRIDLFRAANQVEELGKFKHEEEWAFRDRVERHIRRSLTEFFMVETGEDTKIWQGVTNPDDPSRFELVTYNGRMKIKLHVDYERRHHGA